MDWDDARIFLAAYRAGSLAAAARELRCSHSTVRRRLLGLERALGAKLFISTPEGLSPTDVARDALPKAEAVESAVIAFNRQVTGRSDELAGDVVVTTIDVLASWIAPAILAYKALHPNVHVHLITNNAALDLSRREADIAVRATNRPPEALFGRRVSRFNYAPFAHHELAERYQGRPREIPWLLFTESSGAVLTEAWYADWSGGRQPVARVTDGGALLSLALAGVGGALLPETLVGTDQLTQIGPALPELGVDIWCLTHSDLRHSARVREFMRCVAEIGS